MNEQHLSPDAILELGAAAGASEAPAEGEESAETAEFQITIRKLQTQVRPRGVLAE
jgi:hypothetical protein